MVWPQLANACSMLPAGMAPQVDQCRAAAYLIINLVSGTSIVFANKLVLSILGFHYVRLSAQVVARFLRAQQLVFSKLNRSCASG